MATIQERQAPPRAPPRKKNAARILAAARVPAAIETMAAPRGVARFEAGKTLAATAEKAPARVYPHFDAVVALLRAESKIVRWNAMQTLAALAAVDRDRRWDRILGEYLAFIQSGNLVTAANAIAGAARIAHARPDLRGQILPALLAVGTATYETPECRNVAIGRVLDALSDIGGELSSRSDVLEFVRRQTSNSRAKVVQQARRLLEAWGDRP